MAFLGSRDVLCECFAPTPVMETYSNGTVSLAVSRAAIREGYWEFVTSNDRDDTAWSLYDLSQNRSETEDLSAHHPERVA